MAERYKFYRPLTRRHGYADGALRMQTPYILFLVFLKQTYIC